MTRQPRCSDDEGTILIMALFFLTALVFLVMVPLTFADTSLRSNVSLTQDHELQATSQSALNLTVDAFRNLPDQGTAFQGTGGSTQPCPYTAATDWVPAGNPIRNPSAFALNGWTVSVSCVGSVPSGGFTSQQRDVVFSVTCVSGPVACPTGVLLRARYLYYDPPTYSSQVTNVATWSQDY